MRQTMEYFFFTFVRSCCSYSHYAQYKHNCWIQQQVILERCKSSFSEQTSKKVYCGKFLGRVMFCMGILLCMRLSVADNLFRINYQSFCFWVNFVFPYVKRLHYSATRLHYLFSHNCDLSNFMELKTQYTNLSISANHF